MPEEFEAVQNGASQAGAIQLDAIDLAIGSLLIVATGVLSIVLRLGLEKRLTIAALRTVVQLLLVGWVLREVFAMKSAWAVLTVCVLMIGAASHAAVSRPSRTFGGATLSAFVTLLCCALLATVTVTAGVVSVDPWYEPQYLIPLLGMALGNGLTGISLCLDSLLESLDARRPEIERDLMLGASRWEAARDPLRDAVRRGMIPIVNSMTVAGIVSLPGMMTGQILAGADPVEAVKYQVVVMFLIAATTTLACIMLALLVYRRAFDSAHRLRTTFVRRR